MIVVPLTPTRAARPVILKVCGLTRRADAEAAVRGGATHLGFVFHSASPRAVSAQQAREIHAGLHALAVGVFVNETAERVAQICADAALSVAQLHGEETPEAFTNFSRPLWRALRSPEQAAAETPRWNFAEAFLLDLGVGAGAARGGTGLSGDDRFAAEFAAHHPAILAGGLTAENVAARITHVFPLGVDVSSGIEASPGVKDETKLAGFLANSRAAFKRIGLIKESA